MLKYNAGVLLAFLFLSFFPGDAFCVGVSDVLLEKPRKDLEEKGVTFEAAYAGDMVSNLAGGLHHRTTYLGNLDLALTLDLDKAGLIPGGKVFVSGNDTTGGNSTSGKNIGDLQTVDNIQAPAGMRFYEWWYDQSLFKEKLSIRAGAMDLASEFGVTEYGSLYINSSFGVPPDLSANVPLSIFPYVGLGARVRYQPFEAVEFLAGIFDGDTTEGGKNIHGVDYRFSDHQGLMLIFEGAYHQKLKWNDTMECLNGSVKFGSWIHTQNVPDVLSADENGNSIQHRNDYGFYGVIDQKILCEKDMAEFISKQLNIRSPSRENEPEEQGLGMFLQFGGAPGDRNTVDYYFGAGLNYTGPIPGRGHDVLGVAVANAFLSERLRKARANEIQAFDPTAPDVGNVPGELLSHESALETTYRIQVNDRFALQPDYQIVFNPSGEQNIKTAHVFLLRFEITV